MKNKKSVIFCLILLNMVDVELSKIINEELDEYDEPSNMEAVNSMINLLDDIDCVYEYLGKDVV